MANEKYNRYLCSRAWGKKREAVRRRANGMCERCLWQKGYAVHHLTYKRIYKERLSDLQLLCSDCHDFVHAKSDYDPRREVADRINRKFKALNTRSEITSASLDPDDEVDDDNWVVSFGDSCGGWVGDQSELLRFESVIKLDGSWEFLSVDFGGP